MKDCQKIAAWLSEHVDGRLDATRKAAVEEHLAACVDCAALLGSMRAGVRALRELPSLEVSAGFWGRLREKLPQQRPSWWQRLLTDWRWGLTRGQRRAGALAGAAVVALTVVGWKANALAQQARLKESTYALQCAERHAVYVAQQPVADMLCGLVTSDESDP